MGPDMASRLKQYMPSTVVVVVVVVVYSIQNQWGAIARHCTAIAPFWLSESDNDCYVSHPYPPQI